MENNTGKCESCGMSPTSSADELFCEQCLAKYPWPILKATIDYFDYALGLVDGTVFTFSSASVKGDWVSLILSGAMTKSTNAPVYPLDRGVVVNLNHIVWCADAPSGS